MEWVIIDIIVFTVSLVILISSMAIIPIEEYTIRNILLFCVFLGNIYLWLRYTDLIVRIKP